MRPIDADALIKDIVESIRLADEWERKSYENKDEIGLKYAISTRQSLMAMLSRAKEAPTIEAEPVRHGLWKCISEYEEFSEEMADYSCESCGYVISRLKNQKPKFCEECGAKMDRGADDAGRK